MVKKDSIPKIYDRLLKEYGPQGWWPLLVLHGASNGTNPTKTGSISGYHVGDYSYPKSDLHRWEIIMGALLTQNTSWPQVEKALLNLKGQSLFAPYEIVNGLDERIKEAIKPAGYFNQKSERLIMLANWFIELGSRIPTRRELLALKGVGPETADSILCYAFSQKQFIVDSYTRRIFLNLGFIDEEKKDSYDYIKSNVEDAFEEASKKDKRYDSFKIYQEFHALLVEHAKRYYSRTSDMKKDFLIESI